MFDRFDAVVLSVEDLAGSRAFYADVFDARFGFEDAVSAMFSIGPVRVVLLAAMLPTPVGPGHIDDWQHMIDTSIPAFADHRLRGKTGARANAVGRPFPQKHGDVRRPAA